MESGDGWFGEIGSVVCLVWVGVVHGWVVVLDNQLKCYDAILYNCHMRDKMITLKSNPNIIKYLQNKSSFTCVGYCSIMFYFYWLTIPMHYMRISSNN